MVPTGPTQRPIEPPTIAPDNGSSPNSALERSFFVQVLDSAGATLALLWFLGGSVLFFVTAGVLAGLAFRDKERAHVTSWTMAATKVPSRHRYFLHRKVMKMIGRSRCHS